MSLADLPNEILDMVFKECLFSGGLEDLILSCKKCYVVGQKYVGEYNEQMRPWRTIRIKRNGSTFTTATTSVIRAILENPDRARHTRLLDLSFQGAAEDVRITRSDLEGLIDYITSRAWFKRLPDRDSFCKWIKKINVEEDKKREEASLKGYNDSLIQDSIEFGNMQNNFARMVLLLLLMCNMEELVLPTRWRYIPEEDLSIINSMTLYLQVHRLLCISPESRRLPFSRLRLVSVGPHPRNYYNHVCSLETLDPFMHLKSLETLILGNSTEMSHIFLDLSHEWACHGNTSNLKTVKLENCYIRSTQLSRFLPWTPHLATFTYSHDTGNTDDFGWSAGAFIDIIARHVYKTLRNLSVTITSPRCRITTGTHCLKNFAALETCRLSLGVISAPPLDGTFVVNPSSADTAVKEWNTSSMWKKMSSIDRMLPANIKNFILQVDDYHLLSPEHYTALKILFQPKEEVAAMVESPSFEELVVEFSDSLQHTGYIRSIGALLTQCRVNVKGPW